MCKNIFFFTFFEVPHYNAKRNSHSSGSSKRQEGRSEICQFSLKCVIVYVRPILFRQPSKFITAMQSGRNAKARRKLCQRNLPIQFEKCNSLFDIHYFQIAFESPHCTVKWTLHHLVIPKGKKDAQKSANSL